MYELMCYSFLESLFYRRYLLKLSYCNHANTGANRTADLAISPGMLYGWAIWHSDTWKLDQLAERASMGGHEPVSRESGSIISETLY